jgi:hypothetical protein
MNGRKRTKINKLLQAWPKGTVALQSWLEEQEVYRQLADVYCKNKWLERIDHGIYRQAGDVVEWPGAIFALQRQLKLKVHVGAITALELNSASHYIPFGDRPKYLLVNASETRKIPQWFQKHFKKKYQFTIIKNNLFSKQWDLGLEDMGMGNFSISISSLERATIECLYLVPKYMALDHAHKLMEKLRTLRPKLLQQLLECCQSVKTKRLFLYLAELQGQPWFREINVEKIHLGVGARKIAQGGKYIAKYQISVPDIEKYKNKKFLIQ